MKFKLNKDELEIENAESPNSGSIKYYEIEVEYDDSWEGLSIEAILLKENEDKGTSVAVINDKMYIDKNLSGYYLIGFRGYRIENNVKTYQISTNLKCIYFRKGAGEIEADNSEIVPTTTEWERYLAQVQEFINSSNILINQANNLDVDCDGKTLTLIKKDGTTKDVNVKGEKGDCNFATFEINDNGELIMRKTENMLLNFNINENGFLTVTI